MDKLKEIKRLEKSLELNIVFAFAIVVLTGMLSPLLVMGYVAEHSPLIGWAILGAVAITELIFVRNGLKSSKKADKLRKEYLEENGLPPEANSATWIASLEDGKYLTYTHVEDDVVTVYRFGKSNGQPVFLKGDVHFETVEPKTTERPFAEDSENDELWKIIDSNSPVGDV